MEHEELFSSVVALVREHLVRGGDKTAKVGALARLVNTLPYINNVNWIPKHLLSPEKPCESRLAGMVARGFGCHGNPMVAIPDEILK